MISYKKYIIEMDGVAVYSTTSYENARKVAWSLIRKNSYKEVIVHLGGLICGI